MRRLRKQRISNNSFSHLFFILYKYVVHTSEKKLIDVEEIWSSMFSGYESSYTISLISERFWKIPFSATRYPSENET